MVNLETILMRHKTANNKKFVLFLLPWQGKRQTGKRSCGGLKSRSLFSFISLYRCTSQIQSFFTTFRAISHRHSVLFFFPQLNEKDYNKTHQLKKKIKKKTETNNEKKNYGNKLYYNEKQLIFSYGYFYSRRLVVDWIICRKLLTKFYSKLTWSLTFCRYRFGTVIACYLNWTTGYVYTTCTNTIHFKHHFLHM